MQLFVRNNRSVNLTPAAVILLEEFEKIYNDYNLAIARAASSFAGIRGRSGCVCAAVFVKMGKKNQ